MHARRRRFLFFFAALTLTAAAAWWWRANARGEILHASLPRPPAFAGLSAELVQRLSTSDQLIRRGSGGITALAELGQLYHANGFLPEAVQCYRGLAQLDPVNARWPHRLACIHAGYGQLDAALPLWQRVIRRAPDYLAARIRLFYRQVMQALALAQRAVEWHPGHAPCWLVLGLCQQAAGMVGQARQSIDRAAELRPRWLAVMQANRAVDDTGFFRRMVGGVRGILKK